MVVTLKFGNWQLILYHTYKGCNNISMLGLKSIHVSKRGPSLLMSCCILFSTGMQPNTNTVGAITYVGNWEWLATGWRFPGIWSHAEWGPIGDNWKRLGTGWWLNDGLYDTFCKTTGLNHKRHDWTIYANWSGLFNLMNWRRTSRKQ